MMTKSNHPKKSPYRDKLDAGLELLDALDDATKNEVLVGDDSSEVLRVATAEYKAVEDAQLQRRTDAADQVKAANEALDTFQQETSLDIRVLRGQNKGANQVKI